MIVVTLWMIVFLSHELNFSSLFNFKPHNIAFSYKYFPHFKGLLTRTVLTSFLARQKASTLSSTKKKKKRERNSCRIRYDSSNYMLCAFLPAWDKFSNHKNEISKFSKSSEEIKGTPTGVIDS